jgi:hypothetical protein
MHVLLPKKRNAGLYAAAVSTSIFSLCRASEADAPMQTF